MLISLLFDNESNNTYGVIDSTESGVYVMFGSSFFRGISGVSGDDNSEKPIVTSLSLWAQTAFPNILLPLLLVPMPVLFVWWGISYFQDVLYEPWVYVYVTYDEESSEISYRYNTRVLDEPQIMFDASCGGHGDTVSTTINACSESPVVLEFEHYNAITIVHSNVQMDGYKERKYILTPSLGP